MEIDLKKYQTNSIFTLSNGYYIDLKVQDNGETIMVVKSPEGAPYFEKPLGYDVVSNPPNLQAALNSEISTLSTELNEEELYILEIIPKTPIPPRESTNSFKIKGVVVDAKGNKLEGVEINPTLISSPPPPSSFPSTGTSGRREEFSSIEEGTPNLTDFENTTFNIGAALILDPEFTDEEGNFIIEYIGGEKIDFSKSILRISKEDYFPKNVGPNLVKNGEEFESPPSLSSNKFEGPTQIIDEKLSQLGDGNYKAELSLKSLELGETVKGTGISQDREIAKKKARSDAEGKLAKKAIEENNKPPVYTLSNKYVIKFVTLGPKIKAVTFTPEGEIFWEGEFSFTAGEDVLAQEAIVAIENLTSTPSGTLSITERNPIQPTPSPQEETEKIKFDIYDIGRIVLQPEKVDIDEQVVEAQVEVQKAENKIVERQAILDTPFELKLAALFNTLKEKLKRLLIPYVLDLISKFGPRILNNILNKVKDSLADKLCPSEDKLLEILKKRNKLVRQLNNLLRIVKTISKILKVTSALIFGLKLGIKIATLTSTPLTFTAQINEGIAQLKRLLNKADPVVSSLSVTAATIGFLLSYILSLLNMLDDLLQSCAQEINPETGGPKLPFEVIDAEINNFKDPTTGEEQDIIDPLTGNPFPYKGFTFEIKNDTSQNFQYPKRYAIARNVQGIQVLRSESSFASNPSILIEELKFVIDRDNLRAD